MHTPNLEQIASEPIPSVVREDTAAAVEGVTRKVARTESMHH